MPSMMSPRRSPCFRQVLEYQIELFRLGTRFLAVGRSYHILHYIWIWRISSVGLVSNYCDVSRVRRLLRLCGRQLVILEGVSEQSRWTVRPNYKHLWFPPCFGNCIVVGNLLPVLR